MGGGAPDLGKFPHFPVFFWTTSLRRGAFYKQISKNITKNRILQIKYYENEGALHIWELDRRTGEYVSEMLKTVFVVQCRPPLAATQIHEFGLWRMVVIRGIVQHLVHMIIPQPMVHWIGGTPNLHFPHLHRTQIYKTQIYTKPDIHSLNFTQNPNLHSPKFTTPKSASNLGQTFLLKVKTTLF